MTVLRLGDTISDYSGKEEDVDRMAEAIKSLRAHIENWH